MDAFNELRHKARAKRDSAVNLATKEFNDTLERINALERDLLGKGHSSRKSMIDCIFEVIPKDKPFTAQEVLTSLIALEPDRDWNKRSIDCHICRLRDKGILTRVRRHHGRELATYAWSQADIDVGKFGDKTLLEAVQQVLGETGPIRIIELTVKLIEDGFYTTRSRKDFRASVGGVLLANGSTFVKEAGKWTLVG